MKAIVVIDMQGDYINQYESGLINRVDERIIQAKGDNELIIYVKNTKKLKSGSMTPDFATGLQVLSSYIFCKEAASILTNNDLNICFENNKITEMELIGVDGNSCIAISATEGHGKGYTVILPCSFIGVKNEERFLHKKEQLRNIGIILWE